MLPEVPLYRPKMVAVGADGRCFDPTSFGFGLAAPGALVPAGYETALGWCHGTVLSAWWDLQRDAQLHHLGRTPAASGGGFCA